MTEEAKTRLLSAAGDPLVHVEWHRVLFLNYIIAPEVLRPFVPPSFELDLHDGRACISIVAVTMRHFRRAPGAPLWGLVFNALKEQRFLNFRTYVRHGGEPGAFFLWGWLSRPLGLPLPAELLGLNFAFAGIEYAHAHETGALQGRASSGKRSFTYQAALDADAAFRVSESGTLGELALERYSGFYARRGADYVFRAWHEPWLATAVTARVEDCSLVLARFPWFAEARLAGAQYAPGCDVVWLGRAHRLGQARRRPGVRARLSRGGDS